MSYDLEKVRAALPMPELLARLGLGDRAKRSALCPWHEDNTPSFGIYEDKSGRWKYKCHAGCGQGDEVDFIQKHNNAADFGEAIRQYAELAGVPAEASNGHKPNMKSGQFLNDAIAIFNAKPAKAHVIEDKKENTPSMSFTPAALEPLNEKQVEALCKWRGYSPDLITWMNRFGLIGRYNNNVAFPVTGGVHYRKKDDGTWRYSQGAKPDLFILGGIEEGALVHCFESQWDALAYADASCERTNVVATRGASNIKLLTDKLTGHSGTLYLWPQGDEPGRKWASDIRAALPEAQIKLVALPEGDHKDVNEWRQHGATDGDVFNAFLDAKDFLVPKEKATESVSNQPPIVSDAIRGEEKILPVPVLATALPQSVADPDSEATNSKSVEARESTQIHVTPRSGESQHGDSRGGQDLDKSVVIAAEPEARGTVTGEGETAPLATTLDKLVEFVKRYVIFTHDEQADAIALWIAHTWCFESFRFTPYLNVCSPEKRCGKTRLLECLQILTPKPESMVRPTEAVLFRTIDKKKPTLLLDEIDTIYTTDADDRSEGLRAVLNAGFQSGPFSYIPRCIGKDHEPESFCTFCPKVIAGIGKNLPDTVRDRSIEIRLMRQTADAKADRFRIADVEAGADALRDDLLAWSTSARAELAEARPTMPEQLSDRQQDMMECLFAIADMAGKEWAERARHSLISLGAVHEDASTGVRLLNDCREIFAAKSKEKMLTNELLEALIAMESADSPWPAWWENDIKRNNMKTPAMKLAKLLTPFTIKPCNIRLEDGVGKGYYRGDFLDAWKRYLEPVKAMETKQLGLI